ncbi:hypothetical protein [Methanococcoides sp. AM1]|uniref:hypothetical protein n=1 Tax=Methanococcoides sp. AM1 TaxID=1201011 RepID=UPI0010823879|nr:hypothetical protein [Methanococcoides sp. AM1]
MVTRLSEITMGDIVGSSGPEGSVEKGTGRHSLVLNIVRQYPEGITVQAIAEFLNLSENRVRDLLEELTFRREIYKRKIPGSKSILYYPNGKLIHKYLQESRDFGDQIFRLSYHEGKRAPRLQIQERKFTLLEGEKVEGSIFIDFENIPSLIEFIEELSIKFDNYASENIS